MNTILSAVIIVVAIGLIAGIGLSVASVIFDVPKDEKEVKIREALPGANCGGCGYSGCDGYAEAVAKGEAPANLCSAGGADTAKAISGILGVDGEDFVAKVALVKCMGDCQKVGKSHNYRGVNTCSGNNSVLMGDKACKYGCLGGGDCVNACPQNCIEIINGIAKVNTEECIGCGKCANACPKNIIDLVPKEKPHYEVICKSNEKGAVARKICTQACIGCGICAKNCEYGAITLENNLASINPELCTSCGNCASKCPQKCIVKI